MSRLIKSIFGNTFESTADNRPVKKPQLVKEIIEEIHKSFYSEVDKLLAEAKISKSLVTDKQDLIDKCRILKSKGFINTKEVKEAENEISRLNALEKENEKKSHIIEAINYFSSKYPNYKFITEDSVKKICEKYGLVYSTVDRYIGTVPDKNLKQIEAFKISDDDIAYSSRYRKDRYYSLRNFPSSSYGNAQNNKAKFIIAAPIKDFNMINSEVKDFKVSNIQIPDPVVMQPVMFKEKVHFLIVTAWGDEASDELVINHKMN